MPHVHVPMSRKALLAILDDIRAHVEAGDSWEGNIAYEMPWSEEIGDPETDGKEVEFRVRAAYRVGNLQGQGGMRMIGEIRT